MGPRCPKVRWLEDKDPPILQELIRESWHDAYQDIYSPQEIDAVFDGEISFSGDWDNERSDQLGTLVADIGDEVIGVAQLALLKSGDGELVSFYVKPDSQGRGAGRALWSASLAVLRDRNCEMMRVWVLARAEALRFYRRRGCEVFEESTFYVGEHAERAIGLRVVL